MSEMKFSDGWILLSNPVEYEAELQINGAIVPRSAARSSEIGAHRAIDIPLPKSDKPPRLFIDGIVVTPLSIKVIRRVPPPKSEIHLSFDSSVLASAIKSALKATERLSNVAGSLKGEFEVIEDQKLLEDKS